MRTDYAKRTTNAGNFGCELGTKTCLQLSSPTPTVDCNNYVEL